MKREFLIVVLGVLLCITKVFGVFGVDEKVLLEKTLASQIEELVKIIIGSDKVIVLVNVTINPELYQEILSGGNRTVGGDKAFFPGLEKLRSSEENFLPGIPLLRREDSSEISANVSSVIKGPENLIKNISVFILVDEKTSDETMRKIKEKITEVFNIDLERGDVVEVKRTFFKESLEKKIRFWKDTVAVSLLWLVGLIVVIVFLFGPVNSFLQNLISTLKLIRTRSENNIRTIESEKEKSIGSVEEGWRGSSLGVRKVEQLPISKRHFSFINQENIDNLIYILKDEPIDTVVIVLSFLPAELSSQVLAEFDVEKKAIILSKIVNKRQYQEEEVLRIENNIEKKIEYLLGGIEENITLLNTLEPVARNKFIEDLRVTNPLLAEKIISKTIPFETLYKLPSQVLQEVVRLAGTRVVAAIVKVLSTEEERNYILSNVLENTREMIKQEMVNTPTELSPSRIIRIKQHIINIIADMEKKGIISLEREGVDVVKVISNF